MRVRAAHRDTVRQRDYANCVAPIAREIGYMHTIGEIETPVGWVSSIAVDCVDWS